MEKWEEGYYITAMAGSTSSSSLVVMSKGTAYTQQSYKVLLMGPHRVGYRVQTLNPRLAGHKRCLFPKLSRCTEAVSDLGSLPVQRPVFI